MQEKKEVDSNAVDSLVISIKSGNMEQIQRHLNEYDSKIVNRLESQSRQPALFFSATLTDHQMSYQIMQLLLEHGAIPSFKDYLQQSILFYICRDGKQKCLKLLLSKNLDLNEPDLYGQTPVYYAAKQNRLNIIHELIRHKVDLNIQDKIAQQTPLFYAAIEGHLEMCRILVDGGCDVSMTDSNGKMASQIAKRNNQTQTYEYLNGILNGLKKLMQAESGNHDESRKNKKKEQPKLQKQKSEIAQKQKQKIQKPIKPKQKQVSIKNEENKGERQKTQKQIQQKVAKVDKVQKPQKQKVQKSEKTSTYRLYKADPYGNIVEATYEQLSELLTSSPDLVDLLKKPDITVKPSIPSNPHPHPQPQPQAQVNPNPLPHESKPKQAWDKVAAKILNKCWNAKGGHHFQEPVDVVKYKLEDYFDIIKEPMDFSLVRKRLSDNYYRSMQEFVRDMNLVFDNCIRYNGDENAVSKSAVEVRQILKNSLRPTNMKI